MITFAIYLFAIVGAIVLGAKAIRFILGDGGGTRQERIAGFAERVEAGLNAAADAASGFHDAASRKAEQGKARVAQMPKPGRAPRLELGDDGAMRLELRFGSSRIKLEQHSGKVRALLIGKGGERILTPQEFSFLLENLRVQGKLKQEQIEAVERFLRFATNR